MQTMPKSGGLVVLPESGEIGAIIEILLGTEPVMASIKLIDGTEITHELDNLPEADAEQDKRYYSIHEWIYLKTHPFSLPGARRQNR